MVSQETRLDRVVTPLTDNVPEAVMLAEVFREPVRPILPATARVSLGAGSPIPTFPPSRIVKTSVAPSKKLTMGAMSVLALLARRPSWM